MLSAYLSSEIFPDRLFKSIRHSPPSYELTRTPERDTSIDRAIPQTDASKLDSSFPPSSTPSWLPRTSPEVPEGSVSRHTIDVSKSRHHIKIAIICALTLEADAIHALFDEHWHVTTSMQMRSPGDTNSYSFGVICGHPVVLVHMPGMGKSNASSVATNCRSSFPNVKLALVVGVCGAVPFYGDKKEIILGDIIISEGLVPYDFGRRYADKLIRKEVLAKPPPEIRGLLNKIKG
ncbi:PFS domain-containing protein (phosphorylase superfamily protein) [Colletotrichum chrysophilum]|uniref:PFS domain-containing protein (Phosphorylase superfamily protein) n=1 Tax=Colletotrichum chrysophilum TaxID=1836956 RepID=A0AAD9A5K1_9PEZI|nr:PFS domain-containing protein (phosphorylase superfamily protein) [Colletotrichum chrysophilum]